MVPNHSERVYLIVKILFFGSNNVQTGILFKILN